MAGTPTTTPLPQRQIRPHKKSRGGCGNCKLRSVKCDETKPSCKRCKTYGVICNYTKRQDADLQFAVEIATARRPKDLSFWPNKEEQTLSKFQMMTALTISTGQRLYIYQNDLIPLARQTPCLLHAILSVTMMHNRSLFDVPNPRASPDEAYHWYKATSLFKKQLTQPLKQEQQGAVWTTAAFLFTLVFCQIEEQDPEECWPLRPPTPLDLDWLIMNEGKRQVRILGKDLAPDPIFGPLDASPLNGFRLKSTSWDDAQCFSPEFLEVFNLDEYSNSENNPFHTAALNLARILNNESQPIVTILSFLMFISNIDGQYRLLLESKNPAALLLLAWWYAKVCALPIWWVTKRAKLEGRAICMYLERYHSNDVHIQHLLQFPKLVLEAAADSGLVQEMTVKHVISLSQEQKYDTILKDNYPRLYALVKI